MLITFEVFVIRNDLGMSHGQIGMNVAKAGKLFDLSRINFVKSYYVKCNEDPFFKSNGWSII